MLAFDPLLNEVRDFDLHSGDVFEAGNEVFLVTMSGDFSYRVVDELGRKRSIAECEWYVSQKYVVPEMVRHIGAWRFES